MRELAVWTGSARGRDRIISSYFLLIRNRRIPQIQIWAVILRAAQTVCCLVDGVAQYTRPFSQRIVPDARAPYKRRPRVGIVIFSEVRSLGWLSFGLAARKSWLQSNSVSFPQLSTSFRIRIHMGITRSIVAIIFLQAYQSI